MNFMNKNVLAPMVRVSTLPMRLLALRYGADLVYSEEIIDFKMLRCLRIENNVLGTIDYVMDDGTVVFRTCVEERERVIFQLATNDADRALKVGKIIQGDVAGIDINMGCPKGYSTKGGMGAAMLKNPENSRKILEALSNNLNIPVTCKIRILPKVEDTLNLVKILAETGVAAIAVHGRYPEERPRDLVHDDIIKLISSTIGNKVVVIANGGSHDFIKTYDDIEYFKQCCGVSSAMIGRAAMWNPSVFQSCSETSKLTSREIIQKYMKLAVRFDNHLSSTKYCITQFLHNTTECPGFRETLSAISNEELCDIWLLSEYYSKEFKRQDSLKISKLEKAEVPAKKIKLPDTNYEKHIKGKYKFIKKLYGKDGWSPKLALLQYCHRMKWNPPNMNLERDENSRLYYCSIILNGVLYTNDTGDKNKRFTEQAISCICLKELGLMTQEVVEKGLIESILKI